MLFCIKSSSCMKQHSTLVKILRLSLALRMIESPPAVTRCPFLPNDIFESLLLINASSKSSDPGWVSVLFFQLLHCWSLRWRKRKQKNRVLNMRKKNAKKKVYANDVSDCFSLCFSFAAENVKMEYGNICSHAALSHFFPLLVTPVSNPLAWSSTGVEATLVFFYFCKG